MDLDVHLFPSSDKTLKVHQVNDWEMLRSASISSLVS